MEFFYDGQIRRYVTQFMRIFIGFKYQAGDGTQIAVPVMYGDMTRQVASIIRENSENKLPSVPRVACYVTGLELDKTRLADATYVSKMNIQERAYADTPEGRDYKVDRGQSYTVERLMPTPFKLTMKADIWTSNTDQKLQLLEQITVLFNPSLEIQTTDNYIDWTSLSVIDLENINFTSRSIPQGVDSDIDICTMEFKMPIYITPPAKVKRMGVVRDIIMNVFDANGDVGTLNSLVYNGNGGLFDLHNTPGGFGVLLLSANLPDQSKFNVTVLNPSEAVTALGLEAPIKLGKKLDWNLVLAQYSGKHVQGITLIHFKQPNGSEITGTVSINEIDPTLLEVTIDKDTRPQSNSAFNVSAIINPLTFNPRPNIATLPVVGTRYLLIDDIGGGVNNTFIADNKTSIIDTGVSYELVKDNPTAFEVYVTRNNITTLASASPVPSSDNTSTFRILLASPILSGDKVNYRVYVNEDGADAWAQWDLTDPFNPVKVPKGELIAYANDIVEFKVDGRWHVVFDHKMPPAAPVYMTNGKTGVQYKWDGVQWLRSFEGEYRSGMWRFTLP